MKTRSRDHDHSPSNRQLDVPPPAVASETGSYSRFKLPDDGWIVKVVPRRGNASHVDKYYYEERSGRLFRSLKEVERYIKGGEYPSKSRAKKRPRYAEKHILHGSKVCSHPRYAEKHIMPGSKICPRPRYAKRNIMRGRKVSSRPRYAKKYIMRGGKVMKLDGEGFNQNHQSTVDSTANVRISITNLPDGWVIEDVPRRSWGGSYKHYYEPGTGRKFRSLQAVFRHLEEEEKTLSAYIEEMKENAPLSKAFKLHPKLKNVSRKRNLTTSGNGDGQTSSFVSSPKKIKWILCNTGGDAWCPFIFETPVTDSVKQQWNQRFMEVMKDDDNRILSSEIQ